MQKKGYSMVEILIVIAILAILVSITVISFATFRNVQVLDRDSDTVVSVLRKARSQTLVSQNATVYGVHFASSTITLFSGSSYSVIAPDNVVTPLNPTDTVITLTLSGSGTDVVFKRLSGETSQSGTIVLKSQATGKTRTVTIYQTGLIEFN